LDAAQETDTRSEAGRVLQEVTEKRDQACHRVVIQAVDAARRLRKAPLVELYFGAQNGSLADAGSVKGLHTSLTHLLVNGRNCSSFAAQAQLPGPSMSIA
jgi:hypothetical protein